MEKDEDDVANMYVGEETTKKELWGWYMYDVANSTFVNTTMSAFLPPYLFLLAQQNENENHQFEFLPGLPLKGATYYSTLTPILVALQALTLLLFGVLGDFGNMRKRTLVFTSLVGSIAGVLMLAVGIENYWLGGVLLIVSNVMLGLSVVMYNAYLPILVRNMPEVRGRELDVDFGLLEQKAMNLVSSRGFIFGYVAGLVLLVINVGITLASSRIVGGGSCNKWCIDCPSPFGNATTPGWPAYNYIVQNETLKAGRKFCSDFHNIPCLAWPGLNPPCGWGNAEDIDPTTKRCLNTAAWRHYSYSAAGARWSLATNVSDVEAAAAASKRKDLCTAPSVIENRNLVVGLSADEVRLNESISLKLDNNNTGCPHFYCSRDICSRDFNPNVCDNNYWGTRINVASGGIWWFVFAFFTYFWLKPRPAPPLPKGQTYVGASMRRMWATVKKIKRLRNTALFILCFWFSSDGIGTITTGATIIAALPPLSFGGLDLGILLLIVNISALLGNIFYQYLIDWIVKRWIRKRIARGDKPETLDSYWIFRTIKFVNLFFLSLLPIWGLPGVGLINKIEFFIAAAIYGFQIGSIQTSSRSLMSHFTPVGCEGEFYSFFELSDKGTAWLGPLVLAIATEQLDDIRYAVGIIVVFFALSALVLFFVDVKAGGLEAINFNMLAEVGIIELKAKNPSIRIEEDEPTIEELEKRAHETRVKITKKMSQPGGVNEDGDDVPGVLKSAKTNIGTLRADDSSSDVENIDLRTSFDNVSKQPDLFTPRDEPEEPEAEAAEAAEPLPAAVEEEEPEEPAPRLRKKKTKKSKVDVHHAEDEED